MNHLAFSVIFVGQLIALAMQLLAVGRADLEGCKFWWGWNLSAYFSILVVIFVRSVDG